MYSISQENDWRVPGHPVGGACGYLNLVIFRMTQDTPSDSLFYWSKLREFWTEIKFLHAYLGELLLSTLRLQFLVNISIINSLYISDNRRQCPVPSDHTLGMHSIHLFWQAWLQIFVTGMQQSFIWVGYDCPETFSFSDLQEIVTLCKVKEFLWNSILHALVSVTKDKSHYETSYWTTSLHFYGPWWRNLL